MKVESFDGLANEDIIHRRSSVMRELTVVQFKLKSGQLEDSSTVRKLRRNLARHNTELRRREIEAGLPKGSLLGQTVIKISDTEEGTEGSKQTKKSRFGLGFIRDTLLGKRSSDNS